MKQPKKRKNKKNEIFFDLDSEVRVPVPSDRFRDYMKGGGDDSIPRACSGERRDYDF